MFPPGRAKLSTSPVATGSTVVTMTIGIVLVACFAARIAGRYEDKDIDLELHEFGDEGWDPFPLSLRVAILNHDIFPLNVTEIAQTLLKRPSHGSFGASEKSYPRKFLWLLRLERRSKAQRASRRVPRT